MPATNIVILPSAREDLADGFAFYEQQEAAMKEITIDPEILGGIPVFSGTRVPVQGLFDHLEAGDSVDKFLESFPDVTKEQAITVLEASKASLLRETTCAS